MVQSELERIRQEKWLNELLIVLHHWRFDVPSLQSNAVVLVCLPTQFLIDLLYHLFDSFLPSCVAPGPAHLAGLQPIYVNDWKVYKLYPYFFSSASSVYWNVLVQKLIVDRTELVELQWNILFGYIVNCSHCSK